MLYLDQIFSRVKGLSRLIFSPSLWWSERADGYRIAKHYSVFRDHRVEYDFIVDVGAKEGQFATFAAARWPSAQIICFEPLPIPRAALKEILKIVANDRTIVHDLAAGSIDNDTVIPLKETGKPFSFIDAEIFEGYESNDKEIETTTIKMRRLDHSTGVSIKSTALLKINAQGFEYDVLEGCGHLLDRFHSIFIEFSFAEFRKGARLPPKTIDFIKSNGFRETGQYDRTERKGRLLQADYLFVRA